MNMLLKHELTEGDKKCLEEYFANRGKPRKNLMKMVTHINFLNPLPDENCWEYIFFDRLLTDEMVNFVLKMKLRRPYYIDELAKVQKLPIEYTAKLVDEMARIGIIEYTSDEKGVDQVELPVFAPGSMENTGMEDWRSEQYPELATAFINYILDLQKKITTFVPMGNAIMRAVPVEESIKNESKKAKFEEISYWIEEYSNGNISVSPCQCRRFRRMLGEGTADLEGEWCIGLGKYAEYIIRTDKGRRITKEEAYDILRKAEERGYVHQVSGIDGPDKTIFICNCNWDSCMALKTSWYTATPNLARSNYIAEVDKEKCVACGGCVEVCPQNAAKLGQKICQKNPVEIKDSITPSDHAWSRKYWQPDFLTARKNVIPETGTAPCKTDCPAHIAVQGYLKLATEGRYSEALQLIKKENPFPAICGRVCARFCEQVCTRGDIDSAVAIDEVKKFIAQQDLDSTTRFVPEKIFDKGKRIAVIGSGPAGLSCAYYLAIYGHSVTVFEKESKLGGMMQFGIPSFRLEKDVVDAEIEILRELGVEFKTGVEVGKDITLDELRKDGFKGFYVAIGAQGGRRIGVNGEDSEGVIPGVDFLKNVSLNNGKGMLNGKVVVIGGGNVAVDVARAAVRCGGETVDMFCLESRDEMPAAKDEVEETLKEKIGINNSWGPKEILTENGKVTSVVFKKCVSVFDDSGKFSPKYDENDTITVEADFVLTAIGQSIQWGGLLEGTKVQLNGNNTAKADGFTYQTAQEDVFVGGDVYTGPRFAIDAIAAGKQGAESLHRFVWEGHSLVLARDRREYKYIDKNNLNIGSYDTAPRQTPSVDHSKMLTFSDERMLFTKEQIEKETARCLSCGAAHVDPNICIGCGLCTTRCKFDAIHLSRIANKWGVTYERLVPAIIKEEVLRGCRIVSRKVKEKKK